MRRYNPASATWTLRRDNACPQLHMPILARHKHLRWLTCACFWRLGPACLFSCQSANKFIICSQRSGSSSSSIPIMATSPKDAEPPTVRKLSINAEEVREAIELEHALSFKDAIKLYPKAIGWSIYFSLGVIMLGRHYTQTSCLQPCLF